MRDRLADLWERLIQLLCKHEAVPVYEEIRNEDGDGKVYWSAFHRCPICEEILAVEASFHGEPQRIAEAAAEAIEEVSS